MPIFSSTTGPTVAQVTNNVLKSLIVRCFSGVSFDKSNFLSRGFRSQEEKTVGFDKVKPGKEQELRDWFGALIRRQDEVRETFAQETVRREKVFLLQVGDESFLIYAIDVEDEEKAEGP